MVRVKAGESSTGNSLSSVLYSGSSSVASYRSQCKVRGRDRGRGRCFFTTERHTEGQGEGQGCGSGEEFQTELTVRGMIAA